MKQQLFEEKFSAEWQRFELLLQALERRDKSVVVGDFARDYRRLCYHLSLARSRNYSPRLQTQLNELVLRGHQQLYVRRDNLLTHLLRFVVADFPQLVRREWRLCVLASVLLYLPTILLTLLVWRYPDLVYSVMDSRTIENFESMYDPQRARVRDAGDDFAMFGHYIQNNIGIGFRTFAGGIVYGLGSLFFLITNGVLFGAVAGHILNIGFSSTFFSFVITHGAFELTAIVLAGAAGLKLGFALLAPGQRSRVESLKIQAKVAIQMMYGVILMLVIAAFIEAFWSSSQLVLPWGKYVVGTIAWAFVTAYFWRMGRHGA